jgi:hypothetical protein
MLVRLAETACFMLPGYWWILLVAAMIGRLSWHIHKHRLDLSWTGVFLSNIIVVLCGFLARHVYYSR